MVFTVVAAWARCHAKLSGLTSKPGADCGADSDSPLAGDGSCIRASIESSADGSSGDLADTLPDPALDQLLPLVRFPLMSDEELAALADHPLRHKSVVLSDLLTEAHLCHAAEEARQLQLGGISGTEQVGRQRHCWNCMIWIV